MINSFVIHFLALLTIGTALGAPRSPETKPAEVIRILFSSRTVLNIEPQDARVALKFWSDMQLQEEGEGFVSEVEIFDSLEDLAKRIEKGEADLVVLSGLEFLEISPRVALIPSTCSAIGDTTSDVEVLLVHRDSGISSAKDLAGKTVGCEVFGTGDLPILWFETLLMKSGFRDKVKFLGEFKTALKGSAAILPVFFRQADACIVRERVFNTMADMNPQLKKELVVIARSEPFFRGLMCFHPDFDPERRKRIQDVSLRMHKSEKGRQILALFRSETLVAFERGFLDSTIALLDEHAALKKRWLE